MIPSKVPDNLSILFCDPMKAAAGRWNWGWGEEMTKPKPCVLRVSIRFIRDSI